MRLVELGWGRGLPEPPADPERVRPGDGGGESWQEVEAAHQQSSVPDGRESRRSRVVEVEGCGAAPGDRDQGVVTCNVSQTCLKRQSILRLRQSYKVRSER